MDRRFECQRNGRQIRSRMVVGQIAANGRPVTELPIADGLDRIRQSKMARAQTREGGHLIVGGHRPDLQSAVRASVPYPFQAADLAQIDDNGGRSTTVLHVRQETQSTGQGAGALGFFQQAHRLFESGRGHVIKLNRDHGISPLR